VFGVGVVGQDSFGVYYLYRPIFRDEDHLGEVVEKILEANGYRILSVKSGDKNHQVDILASKSGKKIIFELKNTNSQSTNRIYSLAVNQLTTYLKKWPSVKEGFVLMDVPVTGLALKYLDYWMDPDFYKNGKTSKRCIGVAYIDVRQDGTIGIVVSRGRSWINRIEKLEGIPTHDTKIFVQKIAMTPVHLFDFIYYRMYLQTTNEWKIFAQNEGLPVNNFVQLLISVARERGYTIEWISPYVGVVKEPWAKNFDFKEPKGGVITIEEFFASFSKS